MTDATSSGLDIAVVGAGAAGLSAAYLLQRRHRVTLFERAPRAGGHVNTVTVPDGPDAGTPVDTGFIVFNDANYPLFNLLLEQLGVASRYSDMSFSYHSEVSGLQYAGTSFSGLFAQRRNLLDPGYWKFVRGILRFCSEAQRQLAAGEVGDQTLDTFLRANRFVGAVADDYVLPLAAAIWSASRDDIRAFPAVSLLRFFDNHGLLRLRDRPQWKTIVGGSQTYVRRIIEDFNGDVETAHAVRSVRRDEHGALLRQADGTPRRFDRVVLAVHADEALRLLEDPSTEESEALGAWSYNRSDAFLHTDDRLMPPNRRAWASWNYRRTGSAQETDPVLVTYDMTRLQGLRVQAPFFVSLNADGAVDEAKTIARIPYAHPCFTRAAMATQSRISDFGGSAHTYYCGSYLGYGFHEDAVRSGVAVGNHFGIGL